MSSPPQEISREEVVRQVLASAVEEGKVSPHDLQVCEDTFASLPRKTTTWGFLTGTATAAYLRLYRKPPLPLIGTVVVTTGMSLFGASLGIWDSQRQMKKALDNPDAVRKAVMERAQASQQRGALSGGLSRAPPSVGLPRVPPAREREERPSGIEDPVGVAEDGSFQPAAESAPSRPSRSRWDDIRNANSREGRNSSWDALRQNEERKRIPVSKPKELTEQEQFDLMLEEERRRSQDS